MLWSPTSSTNPPELSTTINQERAHEALNRMLRYVATPTTYKETVSGDAYIHYDGAPGVKVATDDMARGLERFVVSPQFTQITHAHRAVFKYLFDFNLSYPPVEDALAYRPGLCAYIKT